jgi:hypothetical protein
MREEAPEPRYLGLDVSVVWKDPDLIEVRVLASNGWFSAVSQFYEEHEALSDFAKIIDGFPSSVEDQREFVLGSMDPDHFGGGTKLTFRCRDRVGHVVLGISLRNHGSGEFEGSADFEFPVEPAAIAGFAARMGAGEPTIGFMARLPLSE